MKKTNLDLIREISKTKSKFISILVIMFLGVFVFTGLKETPPAMRNSVNTYFKEVNIYDLHISNDKGLKENSLDILRNNDKVDSYEIYYKKEADLENFSRKVDLLSLPKDIAKTKLVSGNYPKDKNEILLTEALISSYHIGDKIKVTYKDKDNKDIDKIYTVAGFVYGAHAPASNSNNKANQIFFAYVDEEDVAADIFSGINVLLKAIDRSDFSKQTYYQDINKVRDELISSFADLASEEEEEFKKNAIITWQANKNKLDDAKKELEVREKSIEFLKNVSVERYQDAKNELDNNKKKLNEQEETLILSKNQIDEYKYPRYMINNIKDDDMYKQFINSMDSLMSIANIFSIFLFSVSILVTLTTISRMVEENRINIGTLKSLGFSNWIIAKKYYLYAILSALSGAVLGLISSYFVIVPLVYDSYARFLIFKNVILTVTIPTIFMALVIVLVCILVAVYIPISKILSERAAYLLRPKAPKAATRILLEYIPFIWARLSFLRKVTFRNIFRYKVRMIMTIFGIMGSLALMFIGFGIKYGVQDIAAEQFSRINNYQLTASYNSNSSKQDIENLDKFIEEKSKSYKKINLSRATIEKDNTVQDNMSIYAIGEELENYIDLYNTEGDIKLDGSGVVINEKLAYLHNLKVGDTFEIVWNQEIYVLKISAINTNYFGHNIYMTSDYYKEIFGKDYRTNTYLIKTDKDKITQIEKDLETNDFILRIQNTSKYEDLLENVVEGIDMIVLVLVCCSTALALVVLYNLININVSERIRELSTIKVLGFYPVEITSYVFREILYLAIIGIIIGNYVGYLFYKKIILDLAARHMMFETSPSIYVYILSSTITVIILLVLMFIVHRKLKGINMVEALKGVE
ncbi:MULTISPECIES: ABC transporter permease [unclassified Gemella]|uniref:ABC transporter permease n=1 Tax=unclassified Gemella TaxID=2624949 RepID=UPI0015D0CAC9|nr:MULTISPECIES: FtsX-like permease family protein [unclassified Gemella]MBF0710447.1 ABC transporter permease [Gemella sp. GL1.1]NYS27791.1 ABC transporter permease [Gemella sp. GL1]